MSLNIFRILSFNWIEIASIAGRIIPPLHSHLHKGQMGRIGVVGGSEHYTGAPYYAAQSALNFGSDIAFVFCSKSAATSIKSYSPELMVIPFYKDEDNVASVQNTISMSLHRLETLVIGPGLGRNELVLEYVKGLIVEAKDKNIPLVIDADGLWILNGDPWIVKGHKRCILTPNRSEFSRLVDSIQSHIGDDADSKYLKEELSSGITNRQVRAVSRALGGVTVVCKGTEDTISAGDDVFVLRESGSPRRCGGQGDILAGALAVSMTWALKRQEHLLPLASLSVVNWRLFPDMSVSLDGSLEQLVLPTTHSTQPNDAVVYAAFLACAVTRRASLLAFTQKGRSMGSPDVITNIGKAFVELWPMG